MATGAILIGGPLVNALWQLVLVEFHGMVGFYHRNLSLV